MRLERFSTNPIIHPGLDPTIGTNINGPSLIRVPPWLPASLGRYYLYFADHGGTSIRLAYADALAGPWRVHRPGTLRLEQTVCRRHIASPDVHIDAAARRILMYFHGPYGDGQKSFLAESSDGLEFAAGATPLGPFYFRVFRHGGRHYAIAKAANTDSVLLCSRDGRTPFEAGPHFLPGSRHTAVRIHGAQLDLFLSRAGDCPEHILVSRLALTGPWTEWRPSDPETLLLPERDWEGAGLPLEPSRYGRASGPVRQLRDPAVYEEDSRTFLLYSVAGESGIAIAELLAD